MALLEVEDLKVHFPIRGGILNRKIGEIKAVDGVSFSIEEGKTYGLVGESGSGKTTLGRAIIGLNHVTDGKIRFSSVDLTNVKSNRKEIRKEIQMVFQDPYSSLNPKKEYWILLQNRCATSKYYQKQKKEKSARITGTSWFNGGKYV